jgi:predicted transcriptional regulator
VELGELELAVLRVVRTLGEASSGEVYDELRKTRDVAYTSVTTTLYRLVEKDLISVRRQSEKKAFYRIKDGRAYRKAMAAMVDSILDTFGGAAVSYMLERPDRLRPEETEDLRAQVSQHRKRETLHE